MFFKKRKIWFTVFVLMACGFASNKAVAKDYVPHPSTPGCQDPIIIKIADIKLSVPRYGTFLKTNDWKQEISDLDKKCDLHFVGNVDAMTWPHFMLADAKSYTNGPLTTYRRDKDFIEAARKTGDIEKISPDLERIKHGASEIYILVSKLAPTMSGSPLVYECEGHQEDINKFSILFCNTSYVMPSGLFLYYKFDRREYPPSKFLTLDQAKRQRIHEMIKGAQ